ncbi:MAG: tetratricopeptide repeat-containing glycosyltransferase family protein [Candidatus Sulfotelmatobacter sp.]|jgi:tetratricopeptide (TPR) repeat protein
MPDPMADNKSRRRSVIQGMLREALRRHRAAQLVEAGQIYQQILAVDSYHADSLHLLGMIAYQQGRPEDALGMIGEAIAINQTVAAYHSNLGTILQSQGKLDEAAASYERAVDLQPELPEAHYNLGNVRHAQLKLDEAAACYEHALALQPQLAEAHYNLGNTLQAQGKLEDAITCYERALTLEPGKYEARHNLGNALQALDKFEEAMECYQQVLALHPGYAKAYYSVGAAFHAMGNLGDALAWYAKARGLQPDLAEAAFAESLAQLLQGEFTPGWRNYESRWQTKEHTPPMRIYTQPLWTGETLASGPLLIWGEQGIGDEIMFAGLIPDAMRAGIRCVLDCDVRLKTLFARSFPDVEVISSRASGDLADDDPAQNPELGIVAQLPIGSLPRLFRESLGAFAATTSPYLIADADERQRFLDRYADGRRLVGLAWYTNNRLTGRMRSINLSLFAPLFARADTRWFSLQYGDHQALQNQAEVAGAPLIIDRSVNQLADIDLFAAQIAAMDLVITIDNSTAHLAGALGIPTCVLLPFASDWRWLQGREDSPWYPTLRLFRQPSCGDWQSVVRRVCGDL